MEKELTVNTVPSLTWNWLRTNKDNVTINTDFDYSEGKFHSLPEGFSNTEPTKAIKDLLCKFKESAVFNVPNNKFGDKAKTAQNARITTAAKETIETISEITEKSKLQCFTLKGKAEAPLILEFSEENNSVYSQIIHGLSDSEGTVILLYKGKPSTQIIQTKIYAEENSQLHIIKVQLLEDSALQLDDTQIICNDQASVQFTQIELGGSHIDSGVHTTLNGYQSSFKSNVAYLCQNNQHFDMNHIVYHYGKKTECDMKVNGTIKDDAVKNYRGTIDFKNGCCGSKGNEMEETLILSPKAVNKSLPVILCDEEDVEGEHGATIGRLSSEILFYMESRGIDEKSAERIMSRAKIQAVADLIPSDEIKNLINSYLDK